MNVTVQEAGRALGISGGAGGRLAACGLLGAVTMHGNRRTVSVEAVLALQNRSPVEPTTPPALVVRVGEPTPVHDDWRSWIGWSETWPATTQRNAVRGDWVIDPDSVMRAGLLVAIVGGFVVAAYTVAGLDRHYLDEAANRRRTRFLVEDDQEATLPFVNRRWALPPGWTVAIIDGRRTTAGVEGC